MVKRDFLMASLKARIPFAGSLTPSGLLRIGFIPGVVVTSMLASCGVDPQIWGNFTSSDFKVPPPAGVQTLEGKASVLGAGASVAFYTPGGIVLPDQATATADGGAFTTEFPATDAFVNAIVVVSEADTAVWGVVPQVPKKATVYDDSVTVTMGTDVAGTVTFMDDLDADATAATLMLLAKAASMAAQSAASRCCCAAGSTTASSRRMCSR